MSKDSPATRILLDEAIAHHRSGRLPEAEAGYRQVLDTDPQQFDALRLLGLLAHQRGDHEEAFALLDRAIVVRSDVAEAFNELGAVHHARNHAEAARLCFERALALQPDFFQARLNLACLLGMQHQFANAEAEFERLASLHGDRAEVYANLGVVQHEQGKLLAAIQSYRKALALNPNLTEAHFNLAQALQTLGDIPSAIQESEALLRFDAENVRARVLLGRLLHAQGRNADAQECFRQAIADKPDSVEARWCSTMSTLAVAYGPDEHPEDSRQAFAQSLEALRRWFEEARPVDGSVGVGSMQPYYLAYHECDNRALLSRYGDLCSNLMKFAIRSHKRPPTIIRRLGKVRVGIVSGKIYDQSVWTAIVKGWCRHLDRRRFELTILSTGTVVDRETELARSLVPDFVAGFKDVRQWADQILDRRFDVLFYPEIGMDGMSVRLASLRLAPIQIASWGHPETTGLPTIDYYISADDFEPPGAQAWYREKLVTLPGMGCIYEPHNVAFDATSGDLSLDRSRVLLLCPGTPYKYDPRRDRTLVEIARRAPECRFVFCHDTVPNVSAMVQKRLEAAFHAAQITFDEHVVFLRHQSRAGFFGLMQITDLCLDTIGFSGFNTTMQALECGLPVVGYEGRFMRGRFASGILRHMGLHELVASAEDQYAKLAEKLVRDVAYLQQVRACIAERVPGLFGDLSPLGAFEDFLESAVRDAR